MNKRLLCICATLFIAVLVLAACSDKNDPSGSEGNRDGSDDASIFEDYAYQPFLISLPETSCPVNGSLVHDDRILYWYTDSDKTVVIVNIAADGSDRQETKIPFSDWSVRAGGLRVTEDGNYAVVIRTYNEDGNIIVYGVYSPQGARISSKELDIIDVPEGYSVLLEQVAFDDSGNIAIIISGVGAEDELHLLDKDGTPLGKLTIPLFQSIITLRDGRVVVSDFSGTNNNLREIDFAKAGLGEEIPLTIPGLRRILPAGADRSYDLLVDDGNYLYGYMLKSDTKITLLNWLESKLALSQDYHIGFLSDNRITILHTEFSHVGDDVFWITDLFILTRIPRDDLPEYTILTIGGF